MKFRVLKSILGLEPGEVHETPMADSLGLISREAWEHAIRTNPDYFEVIEGIGRNQHE